MSGKLNTKRKRKGIRGRPIHISGICPRCGRPYSFIGKNYYVTKDGKIKEYYYAYHREKKRYKRCYLGPAWYSYVTLTHKDANLTLSGYINDKRYEEYKEKIDQYIIHRIKSKEK